MATNTDQWQDLMVKAQNGNSTAYNKLLNEMRLVATKFVRSKVYDPALVEDIVQEVLFGIHNARHTYDSSKPFMPWFNAIIRYKTIDAFRKVGRNKEDELSTGEDIETFFQDDANKQMQALDRHDLMNALAQLPEKPRQAVILMKLHGLTADEAGKVMGMKPTTVKVAAHRAYKTLKTFLERQ
ncbi:MAG: RNA polymerase subunit sigma [Magnetococcales bacterium]|nr:RNA polymerase subunit sigma [Magnetococcales bacterium]|tara:strand:+ start:390886 stop:391434 length:549 start_codon:yes stop_codon:yes gene_type:complete